MNWRNLLEKKCPKCGGQLAKHDGKNGPFVSCEHRDFSVGLERYREIVASLRNPAPRPERERPRGKLAAHGIKRNRS